MTSIGFTSGAVQVAPAYSRLLQTESAIAHDGAASGYAYDVCPFPQQTCAKVVHVLAARLVDPEIGSAVGGQQVFALIN